MLEYVLSLMLFFVFKGSSCNSSADSFICTLLTPAISMRSYFLLNYLYHFFGEMVLPLGQPDEKPASPHVQPRGEEKTSVNFSVSVPKLGSQNERSPEQQVAVKRIGQIDPFVGLQRDEDLFTSLNHWRELGICARVITMDRLGLAKSLVFYTQHHTKRRSGLLVTKSASCIRRNRTTRLFDRFVSLNSGVFGSSARLWTLATTALSYLGHPEILQSRNANC